MARGLSTLFVLLVVLLARGDAAAPQHYKGTVVSVAATKIAIKEENGKEQSFEVGTMAKITVHGKPGRLEEFEATMPVLVTTDAKGTVLAVSTVDRHKGVVGGER